MSKELDQRKSYSKPENQNILFLVLDTARASTVLQKGDIMPNLNRIAKEGTSFTNAFANGPWTLPSHASMFTGQYTSDHGAHAGTKKFDPKVPPLAEHLSDNGYQTVAFSNNTWVSEDFGYDRGFDDFHVSWNLFEGGVDLASIAKQYSSVSDRISAVASGLLNRDAPKTIVNALYAQYFRKFYDDGAWLTNHRIKQWLSNDWDQEQPFFMFVNFLEPHLKYDPPRRFRKRFLPEEVSKKDIKMINQDAWRYLTGKEEMTDFEFSILNGLYKAELNYLDHRIGKLYDYLDDSNLLKNTTIVVVGDHGENIGDHGLMDHQYCLYDTLTHVPLVIQDNATFAGENERTELVELRDLYPTILDIAGIDPPVTTSDAHSLAASPTDDSSRNAVFAEYITPQPSMETLESQYGPLPDEVEKYDRGLRSVRTDSWKLIEGTDGSKRLFEVLEIGERKCRIDDHPEIAERLQSKLQSKFGELSRESTDSSSDMDAKTKQRLEDLGYLQE